MCCPFKRIKRIYQCPPTPREWDVAHWQSAWLQRQSWMLPWFELRCFFLLNVTRRSRWWRPRGVKLETSVSTLFSRKATRCALLHIAYQYKKTSLYYVVCDLRVLVTCLYRRGPTFQSAIPESLLTHSSMLNSSAMINFVTLLLNCHQCMLFAQPSNSMNHW